MANHNKTETADIEHLPDELAKFSDQITLKRRTELECEKNHFYYLTSGTALVKIYQRATEILDSGSLWNSSDLPNSTLVALNECRIWKFSEQTFKSVSDPGWPTGLLSLQTRQLQGCRARLTKNQNLEAAEKVASLMLELSKGQYEFLVLPTQVELSEVLGISREAFNKSIRSFIKKGWMVKLGQTHKITNRPELSEFAEKPLN